MREDGSVFIHRESATSAEKDFIAGPRTGAAFAGRYGAAYYTTRVTPDDPLEKQFTRLKPEQKRALRKLGVRTVRDLLYHFPARYESAGPTGVIAGAMLGSDVTLYGTIRKPNVRKTWKSRRPVAEAYLEDASGKIKMMWFSQPYIAKTLRDGMVVKATGRVGGKVGSLYLANPEIDRTLLHPPHRGGSGEHSAQRNVLAEITHDNLFSKGNAPDALALHPVYPESKGVSSLWFHHAMRRVFDSRAHEALQDPVPKDVLERYHLPTLRAALVWIHAPKSRENAEAARKRFAFEEIFALQITMAMNRAEAAKESAQRVAVNRRALADFIASFPFPATAAQTRVIEDIVTDFEKPHPMTRLLEGDVGSGKTAVAAATAYAVVTAPERVLPRKSAWSPRKSASNQVAYMCPTEILAKQHFSTFISYFKNHPIKIGLLTGNECRKFPSKIHREESTHVSKAQFRAWVANGEIPIVIGTHALIEKSLAFENLAYAIIDEQHRFGVAHRFALSRGKSQTKRGSDAEDSSGLLYRDLTYRIRAAIFAVKKELGLGHKESVYAAALAEEFTRQNLSFSREVRIQVKYQNKPVGTYVPDFVIENAVVLELKSLYFTGAKEKKQLWSYLKGSPYRLGLLVNFTNADVEISRVVFDIARDSASRPRESALSPHYLSMTATPIPRTLALTMYGDLDLSLLDEMPVGRKPIVTEVIAPDAREKAYERVRAELAAGRQAYVICPRIDEPDPAKEFALQAKSVKAEAERLQRNIFKNARIGILHGKMKPTEKEESMNRFLSGKTDILVATSVVEVGVNVPNAAVILIEGAERFGLSQLHQLRGRVIRSVHQSYCFALPESYGPATKERMKAFQNAKNGFELAEYDLALRGAGELGGGKQWGVSDIAMEALKNLKLVEAARMEAAALVAADPLLKNHPALRARASGARERAHME